MLAQGVGHERDSGAFLPDSHALIVYDDLSKQAVAYRQMSLLLRRPPGREAYPGDVFYLHSRLLERAAKVNDRSDPCIIETQAGDVSAYIPTNVISITGESECALEPNLFNAGIRPAHQRRDAGIPRGWFRADQGHEAGRWHDAPGSRYLELAAFTLFMAADLESSWLKKLERGARLVELLKQPQYQPMPTQEQVVSMYAATRGFMDDVPVASVQAFERDFLDFIRGAKSDILDDIVARKVLDADLEARLKDAILEFKKGYNA